MNLTIFNYNIFVLVNIPLNVQAYKYTFLLRSNFWPRSYLTPICLRLLRFTWSVFDILEIFVVDRETRLSSSFSIPPLNPLTPTIKFWPGRCLTRGNPIGWKTRWAIVCWCCWTVNRAESEARCDINLLVYAVLYKLMI